MRSLPNIDKSAFRRGEYVGYGAGRVWRIRKLNRWHALANLPGSPHRDFSFVELVGDTLADISRQLAALPIDTARTLPAVNAVEG